ETATYGKIRVDDNLYDLRSVEAEFLVIVIDDAFAPQDALPCKSQVSTPVNNEIYFRISFDESDDEDYTIICDKNSFSYKMIFVNNLKTASKNDYEKVIPSIPLPKPAISCFEDLDFFKDFENEFPAILYNDAQTYKSDLLIEPILNPQHIDEFNLNDETSMSEYDEEEQNILYFNDLFPFNIIRPDDLKSEKDDDDNDIDLTQSLLDNEIIHGMLFYLIMNLCAPFGVPFDSKRYYKDGDCAIVLRRPRYEGLEYSNTDITNFEARLARIHRREVHRVQEAYKLEREFILALGLHTDKEMQTARFGAYWAGSAKQIPDKGDLRDYWMGISSAGDFLGTASSYTVIRDPILRLCHRLIACSIAGRSQAPKKFVARLAEHFGLLTIEILGGLMIIAHELPIIDIAELVRLQIYVEIDDTWAWVGMGPERQPDAMAGAPAIAKDAPAVDEGDQAVLAPVQAPQQPPPLPPAAAKTMSQRMVRLEEDVHEILGALTEQREVIDVMARDFSRFSTWVVTRLGQMMDMAGVTYVPYSQTHIPYQRRVKPQLSRTYNSQTYDPAYLYLLIKPGSKFSTIVHEYVKEPSRIFTPNARMVMRDDFK
ncbi:hypothetical protein Tco_0308001, partial [Tanacetum coccineum]